MIRSIRVLIDVTKFFLFLGAIFFISNLEHGFSSPLNQDSNKRNRWSNERTNDSFQITKTKKRRLRCSFEGCLKHSQKGGLCKAHGGGSRCSFDCCVKHALKGGLCIAHGGGSRCSFEGCVKSAKKGGLCKAHGGGLRCSFEGCVKSAQKGGLCIAHGGGSHCSFEGCVKLAQKSGLCKAHGGGSRCSIEGCVKSAKKPGLCAAHEKNRGDDESSFAAETDYPEWLYELCGHDISGLVNWIDGDLEHFNFD